jgi:hypothetical protein
MRDPFSGIVKVSNSPERELQGTIIQAAGHGKGAGDRTSLFFTM